MIHRSVLLNEVIRNLNLKPGMTVVDGTLGAGGHSVAILKRILPGGKLISIDWDRQAVDNFKVISEKLNIPKKNLILASDNYANLSAIIRGLPDVTSGADAIFADLGFSSDQIEDAKRGFSFLRNGPLDMRYSQEAQKLTAADIANGYSEKELVDIFWKYGEEKYAKKIAKEIVKVRKIRKIRETKELVEIILNTVHEKYKRARIHPATKVFQALRIEVNQELENLKEFLEQAVEILTDGGRLAVISFHSLEDRVVKDFFRKESRDCLCPPSFPKCVCAHKRGLKIITKKPIVPSEKEIRENPRARSARLRVAEKI